MADNEPIGPKNQLSYEKRWSNWLKMAQVKIPYKALLALPGKWTKINPDLSAVSCIWMSFFNGLKVLFSSTPLWNTGTLRIKISLFKMCNWLTNWIFQKDSMEVQQFHGRQGKIWVPLAWYSNIPPFILFEIIAPLHEYYELSFPSSL